MSADSRARRGWTSRWIASMASPDAVPTRWKNTFTSRSSVLPARSRPRIVASKLAPAALIASRSARHSANACSNAGRKCSSLILENGGSPKRVFQGVSSGLPVKSGPLGCRSNHQDGAEVVDIGQRRPGRDEVAGGGEHCIGVVVVEPGASVEAAARQRVGGDERAGVVLAAVDAVGVAGE